MKKIVNINGIKMVMDEDGNLSKLPDKYYDVNEMKSNNLTFISPFISLSAKCLISSICGFVAGVSTCTTVYLISA